MSDYQGNIIIKNPAVPTGPVASGRAPGMWKLSEVAYWIKQGVWPDANIISDQYFPYVSLLLSTTSLGNANNNLFVDSSGAFNPISRTGNTTQGSATPYSTNWSNYFDGSGDYLDVTSNAAFGLVTGDFTIEMWVFPTANPANGPGTIFDLRSGPTASATVARINSSLQVLLYNGPANTEFVTGTVSLNTWTHIAFVRSSGTVRTYINGALSNTTTMTSDLGSNQPCFIGVNRTAGYEFNGNISNFRIVKGTAVYTSNFTVPTAPLTAISGTSILTCQSNRFRDASTNNFTITANGNTAVTEFSPFAPAYPGISYNQSDIQYWSGYFDGSGGYLTAPANAALAVGTGQFTLECWLYFTTVTNIGEFLWADNSGTTGGRLVMYYSGGSLQIVAAGGAGGTSASWTPVAGQWYHIAASRDASNNQRLFVNGALLATATSTNNYTQNGFAIARAASMNGYISNVRLVVGSAVYTAAFTPPTAPLTAVSGTSLLTCQNAAFTDNSTNNFVITPNGNATVTGNSPFNPVGYWSNYLTTNSFITLPNNAALQLGSGDFCVEAWVFMTSLAASSGPILTTCANLVGAGGINFAVKSTGAVEFFDYATTSLIASGGSVSIGQWTHVAATRSGTTLRIFVNGAVVATGTTSSNFTGNASQGGIGSWVNNAGGLFFGGYISNLRVVKGSAVYTSAFTVPTAPLTAISGTTFLACQSSRFADTSSSALTLTPSGSPSVQSFDPFYTSTIASNGGSMYFDGASDYLTSPTSPAYDFGSGNFTIEGWFYFTNSTANALQTLYSNYTSFSPAGSIFFGKHTIYSGYLSVWFSSYSTGSALLVESTYPPNNAWTHYALVRNGNTFTLYRNGVSTASATWTGAATAGACPAFVGAAGDALTSYNFPGYMNGFRITKSAVYTAAFTPPTAPLTPSASTTMLLNGMNAGIYDATTINDMETVGNAQTRNLTPFPPANYYAGYFDGSGDYLATGTSSAIALGTADFTFECWVYPSSYPNDATLVYIGSTSTGNEISLQIRNGQVASHLYISGSHSDVQFTDLPVSLNTWSHLAISRVSGVLYGFLNGVRSSTAPSLTANFGTSAAAYVAIGNRYAGSISNARITKNAAVYSTSTYTVPTSPLAASANTAFLTCQNKTFIDNSPNALPITVYGGATAGVSGPFIYTGASSVYFDGTGDYLTLPDNPSLRMGSGNFTLEFWWYPISLSGFQTPFEKGYTGSGGLLLQTGNGDGRIVVYASGSAVITASTAPTVNTWSHMALVRNGTSLVLYLNGTSVGSATNSTDFNSTSVVGIGANVSGGGAGAYPINGYIDDFRITRGVARYTSNFTPPTQAFPTY